MRWNEIYRNVNDVRVRSTDSRSSVDRNTADISIDSQPVLEATEVNSEASRMKDDGGWTKKGAEQQREKGGSRKDETGKGHYPPDFMAPRRRKQSKGTTSNRVSLLYRSLIRRKTIGAKGNPLVETSGIVEKDCVSSWPHFLLSIIGGELAREYRSGCGLWGGWKTRKMKKMACLDPSLRLYFQRQWETVDWNWCAILWKINRITIHLISF